jgi:hypothetical protein
LPAGIVELPAHVCCGALLSRAGQPGARRRPGGSRFTFGCFWCTLRVCRVFGSSAHGPAQPSSNYAFKRTAGTLHRVSCCSLGPRPLNAPLAVRGTFVAASASSPLLESGGLWSAFSLTRNLESHSWRARRKLGARNSRSGRSPRRLLGPFCSGGRRSGLTISSLAGPRLGKAYSLGLGIGLVGTAHRALACLVGAGYRAHVGLSPVRRSVVMACRSAQLTRRSSGPRGQSIVFPAVLSARGRLTRR